jgi:sugar O-acyltransferase (sialic acid O-acetyltransferase NeuD family)
VQELNRNVIVLGYSGHALVVIESVLLNNNKIFGYADFNESDKNPYSLRYLGSESDESFGYFDDIYSFVLGIGDNEIRTKVFNYINNKGGIFLNVIHPSASISNNVIMGKGVFVAKNTSINPFSTIANNVIINTGSNIDQECIIDSGVHLAPNATLLGNVKVGKNTFIGANSVVKQGVTIGENVIIGAGSVVLRDVSNNSILYGNPAKLKDP